MAKEWSFDSEPTRNYTRIRQAFISDFLEALRGQVSLQSAVDVGCGVGYFSKFLFDRGMKVVAVDGRAENVAEGQRRHPEITFLTKNVEDSSLSEIGLFDLVLCVGLLYHLENPFHAIRNLHGLTGKVLIIESMCVPGEKPALLLLEEGEQMDQGLNYVAFYPTESCLVKMLRRAGFPFVYRFSRLPADAQFTSTRSREQSRTFLAASKIELSYSNLVLAAEPSSPSFGLDDPWTTGIARAQFSLRKKLSAFKRRLLQLFSASNGIPISGTKRD